MTAGMNFRQFYQESNDHTGEVTNRNDDIRILKNKRISYNLAMKKKSLLKNFLESSHSPKAFNSI